MENSKTHQFLVKLLLDKSSNTKLPSKTYFPALSLLKFNSLLDETDSTAIDKQIIRHIETHEDSSNTLVLLILYYTFLKTQPGNTCKNYSELFINLYESLGTKQFIFLSKHLPIITKDIILFLKRTIIQGISNREKDKALKAFKLMGEIIINRKDLQTFKILLKMNLSKQVKISEYAQKQIISIIGDVYEKEVFKTTTILQLFNYLVTKHKEYPRKLFVSVTEKIPRFLTLYYNFQDFELEKETRKFVKEKLKIYLLSFKNSEELKTHFTDSFIFLSLTKIFKILYWATEKGVQPLEALLTDKFLKLMTEEFPFYFGYLNPTEDTKELLLRTETLFKVDRKVIMPVLNIMFNRSMWNCDKIHFITRFITQQWNTRDYEEFIINLIIGNSKVFPREDIAKALKMSAKGKTVPKGYMWFVNALVSEGSDKCGFLEDSLCEMVGREFWKQNREEWLCYIKIIDRLGTAGFYSVSQLPDVLSKELLDQVQTSTADKYKDFIDKYY